MIEEPVLEMMPMQWQAVLDVNRDEDDVAICWWHQVWLMEIHRDVDKLRRILAATIWYTHKDENEADKNEFQTFIFIKKTSFFFLGGGGGIPLTENVFVLELE